MTSTDQKPSWKVTKASAYMFFVLAASLLAIALSNTSGAAAVSAQTKATHLVPTGV